MAEDRNVVSTKDVVVFGPFRLFISERRIEKSGVALKLGSRSLDILIALVEQAGQVVTKRDLIARVWPDVTVDESSLRGHVAGLRKALGDGEAGARYVSNVQGRGYCFVAPLAQADSPPPRAREDTIADKDLGLPPRLARMLGRDEAIKAISGHLEARRFVTIVGPGGIGKTTVAISLGHTLIEDFDGAARFLDLGPLRDPQLVPTALASALGIIAQSSDPTPGLINYLRQRRLLLIFDSCEHVIESVAALTERIFEEAPFVHMVATSREALRVEGEHVYLLPPLDTPPESPDLTSEQTLAFPAAQLFLERAAASGYQLALDDREAPIIADICRRLDGIALAIELAAGRVGAHGLSETAALIENRFQLLWRGRRTALPRHQTLGAMLDWSYDLLTDPERATLRRLSVFVGSFTREAAQATVSSGDFDMTQLDCLSSLVSKSLISASAGLTTMHYRLLDTTRAYALEKLVESGEAEQAARRHATYYCDLLEGTESAMDSAAVELSLANVRSALEWSFSERGDTELGVALAAASARLFLDLSLLSECRRWTEQAIEALDDTSRGTLREMELQGALGLSLMFTKGNNERARLALTRGLELAEQHGDTSNQLRLLGRLHIFHERAGEFHDAFTFARRSEAAAREIADPVGISAAHSVLGISYHLAGSNREARTHLEAALALPPVSWRINTTHFGFHHHNRARIALARTLWLQGCSDQACRTARHTVEEAATLGHPVTLCIAIIWALSVFHWLGDVESAQESIERFEAQAYRHSFGPYIAGSIGMRGRLAVEGGDAYAGIARLRESLELLHADRYELLTTEFNVALTRGLALAGDLDGAMATLDETIALVNRNGDLFHLPELLRLQGDVLASLERPRPAEACYADALETARRQGSLGWELRAATSFAKLHLAEGRRDDARELLTGVYERFTEGFGTTDLIAAKQVLDILGAPPASHTVRQV